MFNFDTSHLPDKPKPEKDTPEARKKILKELRQKYTRTQLIRAAQRLADQEYEEEAQRTEKARDPGMALPLLAAAFRNASKTPATHGQAANKQAEAASLYVMSCFLCGPESVLGSFVRGLVLESACTQQFVPLPTYKKR